MVSPARRTTLILNPTLHSLFAEDDEIMANTLCVMPVLAISLNVTLNSHAQLLFLQSMMSQRQLKSPASLRSLGKSQIN